VKKLIVTLMLAVAFLAGYYLGQRPGSPDIFSWGTQKVTEITDVGQKVGSAVAQGTNTTARTTMPQTMAVQIGNKTYVIGEKPGSKD